MRSRATRRNPLAMAAPPPHRPRIVRWLNRVGPLVASRWPSLDPEDIFRNAAKRAKSEHFGDRGFLERLSVLVDVVEREANLHWIGRLAVRQSLVAGLQSRFSVYRRRAMQPELAGVPVEKPLFIVGFPRTGTTILFNLLAQDPANRTPLGWEVQFPDPPPEPDTLTSDPRIGRARKYFGQMDAMAPILASIHEVGAELPQECMPIMAHTLLTPQPSIAYNIPSYQDWVDLQDAAPAYTYHRHFLEHLQSRYMNDRWVLKSPVHLATLDALLAEYPDARLIFTHRDPAKTIPSLASLVYTVRGIVSDSVDPKEIGPEQLTWWARALDQATQVRARHADKAAQFMDIQFDEIIADPVAAIRRAYDHFEMPWSQRAEEQMRSFLAANPRGKHGTHRYSLEDFGLELDAIRERFADYCERYDVAPAP
jgi:hypothetical protein